MLPFRATVDPVPLLVAALLVSGCERTPHPTQPSVVLVSQATDVEPNNSCQAPQDVGAITSPLTVTGSLDPVPPAGDLDFFRITGTPNAHLRVDLEGQSSGKGTLDNPLLGVFDSNCNPIVVTDTGGIGLNAGADISIPADGVLIVGATSCCDFDFTQGGNGSYELTIQEITGPANDNFANAIAILALPFDATVDITNGGLEPGEPTPFCNFSASGRTAWYAFTPATTEVVSASTNAPFATAVGVYTGSLVNGLTPVACRSTFGGSAIFRAFAGTTYYFLVDGMFGQAGNVEFRLDVIPPPPNDDFANATAIAALPFDNVVDLTAASLEAGEPTPTCSFGGLGGTAWYRFTPSETRSISALIVSAGFSTVVAAYTGGTVASLTQVGCSVFGGRATFRASAGTIYYFQVAGLFSQSGPLQFRLEVTQPPVANFSFFPGDPSVFDVVQFGDNSFDPGGVGFASRAWSFGDGSTATTSDCCVTHRYAADGDYTAQLTATTVDGRTASVSQPVHVRTHDVAIIRFAAPNAANAGQTRNIVVGLNSRRYVETVEVRLFKSGPGGFQQVGLLTQTVPVRPSNRTTDFGYSYTFTSDDASIGKVTFKVVAAIVGARDALPADNEAIAAPTKVGR